MITDVETLTSMDVQKASTVEGRNGPQWELTVKWPWTVGQNTDRTWLEKSEYPDEPGPGRYQVAAVHRGLKNKKEGGQHDGTKGWMWNWAVVRFVDGSTGGPVENPPTSATWAPPGIRPAQLPAPEPLGAQDYAPPRRTWDATGASIERQVALKASVELAGYIIQAGKGPTIGAKEVLTVATLFDRWLGRHFDLDMAQGDATTAPTAPAEAGAVLGDTPQG